jgi:glycine/D-amino acid oxidase-like deaminating enzyme
MGATTIVIGAGVVGLCVAERLAAAGDRVIVVDRSGPGAGTSGTSFVWLNANSKVPRAYHQLNVDGVEAWRRASQDSRTTAWLHLNGRIQWASGEAAIAALETAAAATAAWGYPVEAITVAAATRLEPDLLIPPDAQVRVWPTEGFLVPPLALEWLLVRALARNVELATGFEVVAIEVHGTGVRGVLGHTGRRLSADRVVCCAGRWTTSVLASVGVAVDVLPTVQGSPAIGLLGYASSSTARLGRTISTANLNVRPGRAAGRYVLQAPDLDRLADPDGPPDPGDTAARELLARTRTAVGGFTNARVDELRVGYRVVPADRITVSEWAPGLEGLYLVVTHSGYTLGLHLAELVAAEVAGGVESPALAYLRRARVDQAGAAASSADPAAAMTPIH